MFKGEKMKGLSLPINLVVIIAIAVLVLLAAAAFFAGGFGPASGTVSDSAALNKACGIWQSRGCSDTIADFEIPGYYPAGGNTLGRLTEACDRVLGSQEISSTSTCYTYCCSEKLTG